MASMNLPGESPGLHTESRLLLIDKIVIGYAAVIAVVALTRLDLTAANWGIALGHALVPLLIWLIRRPGHGPVGTVLGDLYLVFIILGFYASLDVLQGPTFLPVHDEIVIAWEKAIFGGLPSEVWWQRYPYPLLSTILHGAYWGYYLMVPLPVLYFAFRGEREHARRAILIEGGTFLFCYLIFVFFPVAGPYNYLPWPTGEVLNNPTARLVYATLADGNSYGAAFPSSHVAATTSAVIAAFIGSRWLGWGLLLPAILLAFGTVYCHMHYAIDAVVGVMVGITVPVILMRLGRKDLEEVRGVGYNKSEGSGF
jgi:membrane-associated phospholipid phosphatase